MATQEERRSPNGDDEAAALLARSRQLTDRLHRLQRISGLLSGAVDATEVGRIVVELLGTPNTSGTRGIWLATPDGEALELVAGNGFADGVMDQYRRIPVAADLPVAEAFRERRMVRSGSHADASSRYPALAGVRRSTRGFLAAPLLVGDACSGVLVVGYDDAELPDLDVGFVEAAAGHVAQTLSRVRLSEAVAAAALESASAAARERRRREQVEFLAELTETGVAASDHRDLMARMTAAAVPRLGDWCALHFLPDGEHTLTTEVAHVDPEKTSWARRLRERHPYDPEAPTGVPAVIRTGTLEFVESVDDAMVDALIEQSPIEEAELRQIIDALRPTSAITVPLTTKRGCVGAMQFISAESGRRYDTDDVALAEAAAGRVADALEAMWLTDHHRRIADSLQRALLPPELPSVPGVEVAARYWPAGTHSEVGGDFYDMFPLTGERWAVVIGDVCGTGADAAAVTSIARHTIRAAARHDQDHTAVLEWANEAVRRSDRQLFCTACYATLADEGGRWRLRTAAGGHPLPLLRRADGRAETIGSAGTLLGVFEDIETTVAATTLEPGDAVLFYTDGITDLPDPFGATLEDLAALLADVDPDADADAIADAIRRSVEDRVPDASRRDDVALLVLRVTPADSA